NAFPGWHEEVAYRERAMKAFTAARDAKPDWYLPHVGFGDAFKADGRDAEANDAYAKAAALGRPGPAADGPAADAIKAAQQSQQWPSAIEKANAFVTEHHDSPRLLEVYDA